MTQSGCARIRTNSSCTTTFNEPFRLEVDSGFGGTKTARLTPRRLFLSRHSGLGSLGLFPGDASSILMRGMPLEPNQIRVPRRELVMVMK